MYYTMAFFGFLLFAGFSVASVEISKGEHEPYILILTICGAVLGIILMIVGMIVDSKKHPTPSNPDNGKKVHRASRPPRPEIVRTKLMAVNGINQTQRSGTVSGAIMGGLIGGGLGALIGAAANTTDRQYNVDNKYTFLVIYDNQTQKLETVSEKYDKKRFDLLVSKLVVED